MGHGDIALGIMCKAPIDGACKTRLCPPLTTFEAAAISRCFIADVSAAIEAAGAQGGVAVYTPVGAEAAFDGLLPPRFSMLAQRGNELGERLLHATDDLLSAGCGGVCLINSDSPTLPSALLQQAILALRQPGDRIVLGPAIDGGYYLIGLKRAHAALFRGVAWGTSQVLAQTLVRAARVGVPVSLLAMWYDVDDLGSLQLLLHELFRGGNPLAIDGLVGSPAPRSRSYLEKLLRTSGAERLGFASTVA
jgi:uncharacterized protein